MLSIKLRRVGKKHQAAFRVVVAEKRSKMQGRYIEDLGWLNPHTSEFNVNKERAEFRIKTGAQPTDTVHNLLVRAGIIAGRKRAVHAKSKKQEEPKAEAPKTEGDTPTPAETAKEAPTETPAEALKEVTNAEEQKAESKESTPEEQSEEKKKSE